MLHVIRQNTNAVLPTKAHPTDIGWDLTALGVFKEITKKTKLLETGLIVIPPAGYYIEILPRSSITTKTPYSLANSVGIIDPDYRGTLKIAVRVVDEEIPEPEFPFCRFQMVLRKVETCELVEVAEEGEKTTRGTGGFGSTD